MGRKLSQASLKISKKIGIIKSRQLSNTIKVLRPKVYITDTSRFKKLVQELTGNGSFTITTSPPPTPQTPEQVPEIEIEDQIHPEISLEEASIDSSELGNQESFSTDQFFLHDFSWMNKQDLESWLMDVETQPFCNGGFAQIEQEVSIYDYQFSGLL